MLTIRYVNPSGMFSYGKSGNIDIERRGRVNLVGVNQDTGGDSNGSGKSSLFNALCEILYGENPTGVSGGGVINNVLGEGFAGRVECVSWEGVYYRVTYCREWKQEFYPADNNTGVQYKGTALFLDKFDGERWIDCREAKMSATRTRIVDALGISYSRFLSIAYLSHRVGFKFLRGTNSERVDILAGITGVEEWDRILLNCRMQKNTLQKTVQSTMEKISYERGGLEQLQLQLQQYESTDWDVQKKEYATAIGGREKDKELAAGQLANLTTQIAKLTKDQQDLFAKSGITSLSQEISDLSIQEAKLRNPQNLEEMLPTFNPGLDQNVYDAKSKIDRAKGNLTVFLRDDDLRDLAECPLCKGKITKVKKKEIEQHIAELQQNIVELEKFYQTTVEARDAAKQEIANARAKAYEDLKAEANAIAKQIEEKQALMRESSSEYERVGDEIKGLSGKQTQLQSHLGQIEVDINQYKSWLKQVDETLVKMGELRETLQDRKIKIAGMENSIESSQAELKILDWLISNIPYIKLHKLSVTMSSLSDRVNKFLADMGDTVRLNISSFKEKKVTKGAGDAKDLLKSDVEVEVVDGDKNIDPRLYSDGETAKIANALIRGLHDLASQSGQGCNIILMDEIFAFVDGSNSQRLVDSFVSLSADTTLVTDNSGHVNDLLAFNETWVARKTAGITALEVQ